MRKIIVAVAVVITAAVLQSCDKNFDKININPTAPTSLNPGFLFANAQVSTTDNGSSLDYQGAVVQQHMNPYLGVQAAGNVNQLNVGLTAGTWDQMYGAIKLLTDVIDKTRNDPNRSNLYNMARIWKSYTFQVLTDTYGDVPYSEAGRGYLDNIITPKYDRQQDIYDSLLLELTSATAALDASKPLEPSDLFYAGDVSKWKKLGNSLLLRVAMRLSKADATKAQTYAQQAFAGGTMSSNADDCFTIHNASYVNSFGNTLNGTEKDKYYINQTFLDSLKMNGNPLLHSIAVVYANPSQNVGTTAEDTTAAVQIGMPIGYDDKTIATAPNYPGSLFKYSQINRKTLASPTAPSFFVTYAQTQLLLAEAAQRGWISGDPAVFYQTGVAANMNRMADYGAAAAVDPANITAYLAAHPYDPSRALQQINTEYWIACFLQPIEAFANWRRSGYPTVAPNNYAVQSIPHGSTIRRIPYPLAEQSVNTANYNAAVQAQGPDNLDTKVWWDK